MVLKLTFEGEAHDVVIVRRRPNLVIQIDGVEHEISGAPALGDGRRSISVDGNEAIFLRASLRDRQILRLDGRTFEVSVIDPFSQAAAGGADMDSVKAPMPGAVVSVQKQPGETITRGETIITIESMKLQTALSSPRDGVLAQILKSEGMTFERDEVLVTLTPETGKA